MSVQHAQRRALGEQLKKLNENMQTLADLSELAIRKAVGGLENLDPGEAREVMALDVEIYALQISIEKDCVDIIALHAPVALDLRTITTSLKIVTDLDRIGRYARDIAEVAVALSGASSSKPREGGKLSRMADLTIHMVDSAVRAFTSRDAPSARSLADFDNAVDDLHDENFKEMISQITAGTLSAEVGCQYILVNRYLERIADHAVNVGNGVVYMVTGERHEPRFEKSRPPAGKEGEDPSPRPPQAQAATVPKEVERR